MRTTAAESSPLKSAWASPAPPRGPLLVEYHACRVGEIAEEAGVAYGLVYHYFGSKEEVLETIFRDTWTQMLARIREVEEGGEPAREQVRKVTALLLRTWRRDPDLVRVLVREVTRSPERMQRQIK